MSYYSSNVQYQRGNQNYSNKSQYGNNSYPFNGNTQNNNESGSWAGGGGSSENNGQRQVFNQQNNSYIINNLKKGQSQQSQQRQPQPTLNQSLGIGRNTQQQQQQQPVGTFPWQQQFTQPRQNQAVESGPVFGPKVVTQRSSGQWGEKNNPIQMLKAGVIGSQSNIKIQLRPPQQQQTQEQEATNELNKQLQVVQLQDDPTVIQPRAKSISLLGLAQGHVTTSSTPVSSSNGLNSMPITNQKDFTWKLQKPGMVFANKTSNEKKNCKAERKNTNTEPKAWLYAWLGFRHKRPEYSHQSIGQRPDQYFKCSLIVEGFNKQAHGQATSKKEAQTEAAWDFISFLKEKNELTATEVDHINVMKKKLKGEKGSVRESLNSTVTTTDTMTSDTKDEKDDQYEKIKKEVEQSKENEVWIEPNPPWLRGNQQMTPVDVFWRSKDLEVNSTGNGTGGPGSGTAGGIGNVDTVKVHNHNPQSADKIPTGSPLLPTPPPSHPQQPLFEIPPFDPSVPPPPLPPPPNTATQTSSSDAPPVIYYPPVQQHYPSVMEDTLEKTQTASNIRDMLEDITKELDNESNMFDCIPRRNIDLEPFDYQILNYCQLISMKDDTFSTLCKARQIVEKGLRDLSNQLVYRECCALNRPELVEFCRDKLLTQKTQMKILTRSPSQPTDESDERIKKEINKLRNVCKVIRTGNAAMDILTDNDTFCDLVLFTAQPPNDELVEEIIKILPTQIDKSLNLGVEAVAPLVIRVSGEILNEKVAINIRLTTEHTDNCTDHLDVLNTHLRLVRQTNWWQARWSETYRIMDRIAALFIWLRRQEHGEPLKCLDEWQLLLVVFFATGSLDSSRLSPGDAVLRVFEALSSGMISKKCQIIDPSEPIPVPFLSNLDNQKAEDLSKWSGQKLRLLAFSRADEVFKIDLNNNYSETTQTQE